MFLSRDDWELGVAFQTHPGVRRRQGMHGPAPCRHIPQGQTLSLFRRPQLLPVVPSPATPCITAWSPSVLLLLSQACNVSLAKSFGGFPEPCLYLCLLLKKKKSLSNLNCNLLGNHTPPLCCQAPKWNEWTGKTNRCSEDGELEQEGWLGVQGWRSCVYKGCYRASLNLENFSWTLTSPL